MTEPLRVKTIEVEVAEMPRTVLSGFHQNWLEGECEGEKFDLSVGAGLGNPWMTVQYRDRHFWIDVRKLVPILLDLSREEGRDG